MLTVCQLLVRSTSDPRIHEGSHSEKKESAATEMNYATVSSHAQILIPKKYNTGGDLDSRAMQDACCANYVCAALT